MWRTNQLSVMNVFVCLLNFALEYCISARNAELRRELSQSLTGRFICLNRTADPYFRTLELRVMPRDYPESRHRYILEAHIYR